MSTLPSKPKPIDASLELELYRRLFGMRALPYFMLGRRMPGRFLARIHPPGSKRPVRLRLGTTDPWVYRSAFMRHDHRIGLDPPPRVIVDAGANVGLTSVFFAHRFRDARVLAIEPDRGNFSVLKRNVRRYRRVEPVQAALWKSNASLSFTNEGTDCDSLQVGESEPGESGSVRGLTLDQLMNEQGIDRIDLLKVDIEGAEREVFADPSAWIDRVDVLVVEIHDFLMPGCERPVLEALRGFEFVARSRLQLLAARDRSRLTRIPSQYRELEGEG